MYFDLSSRERSVLQAANNIYLDYLFLILLHLTFNGKIRRQTKVAHVSNSRSCCLCSFLCKYICSRQSRKAHGRFHRVDRENFHKDSGREKQIRAIKITNR